MAGRGLTDRRFFLILL